MKVVAVVAGTVAIVAVVSTSVPYLFAAVPALVAIVAVLVVAVPVQLDCLATPVLFALPALLHLGTFHLQSPTLPRFSNCNFIQHQVIPLIPKLRPICYEDPDFQLCNSWSLFLFHQI